MTVDQEFQDDPDSDYEDNKIDDVDDENGQIPDVVLADDIFLGLCFLFYKNRNSLKCWKGQLLFHVV